MTPPISRRDFLVKSALAGAAAPLLFDQTITASLSQPADNLKINIFSKHLQFLNFQDMSEAAKEIGFDGIDLTVRPKGHVLPDKVETDLPLAVEAMKKVGFSPSMFCTAVEDATNPVDKKLLETASKLGFKYYRMNWYKYNDQQTIPQLLDQYREKMAGLGKLNEKLNLIGCYQNHAGRLVGASMFEVWQILQKANPKTMGAQYDIRHATLEGGLSWQTGFNLIKPSIRTIVLKDFMWEKTNGKWGPKSVPLGEGMVDFKTYFKLLKDNKVDVPICLHLEYPLGGADQGAFNITVDKKVVFDAMKRDLQKAKELWAEA
ncbi:sugar phosphate isomerase/epimerase family protein [Dyadobacter aurulentus]|uniref:sugar phosphate isomerase/epimerase family protein n=1 Tax=Dyadobacter sp. UC 10 TaxID=2605428 RepID=UPI0011F3C765|nr:sugar phosphate isomerase/epimerase family protein [Dyadobacter sp. UC 10]KAA0989491.1 sugar phosphate isomerase/epimerase [Dyadobacter sp. UC 10]